jgi:hypothetical protein
MVPVAFNKVTITFTPPVTHAGFGVVRVAVPPSGVAFTVNTVPAEVTLAQLLDVITRTFTSYVPALKPLNICEVGSVVPDPIVVQVTPLSVLICAIAKLVAAPV